MQRTWIATWFQLTAARRRLDIFFISISYSNFLFQLTAARRRLGRLLARGITAIGVSTHSRPKAAGRQPSGQYAQQRCFNSQPPEGGWLYEEPSVEPSIVSTHSRPKAAGSSSCLHPAPPYRFNSQPPEGGWSMRTKRNASRTRFNSQPPEGGWLSGN